MNIEPFLASPETILSLCKEIVVALDAKMNNTELLEKEKLLKEISRSIEKLEKIGIPVPDQLRSLKTSLVAELAIREEINRTFEDLANGFDGILKDLYIRLEKPIEQTNRSNVRKKRSSQPKTDREVLRKEIIFALKSLGNRGSPQEVEEIMEQRLKGKLLQRDLEHLTTGELVWRNNAEWERLRMVKEGVLKKDSPRGIWELNKEYL
jgi:hypothetical protein